MEPREEFNQIHQHEMDSSAFSCDFTHSQSPTSARTGTVDASSASNPNENFAAAPTSPNQVYISCKRTLQNEESPKKRLWEASSILDDQMELLSESHKASSQTLPTATSSLCPTPTDLTPVICEPKTVLGYDSNDDVDSDSSQSEGCMMAIDADYEEDPEEQDETAANSPLDLSMAVSSTHNVSSTVPAKPYQPVTRPLITPGKWFTNPTVTNSGEMSNHSTFLPSSSTAELPHPRKRRKITDEKYLQLPLNLGWKRSTQFKMVAGKLQGKVNYVAPCGKKMREHSDIVKYLFNKGITAISRDNFSFSAKLQIGDFYEAKEGPEGLEWLLLKGEEVAPRIKEVFAKSLLKSESKLQHKVEAQERARLLAEMKKLQLEIKALVRASKEARKKKAMLAAEELRKKKEQEKILKKEAAQKKKEQAANAKILQAQMRNKEKEQRKQEQMLMKTEEARKKTEEARKKAEEARKKAEEKERLKKEKEDEKVLSKKKKVELRSLELAMAKEWKNPKEDMSLADHKPLPELSRIPGLILPARTISDCLMLQQFIHNFGEVLTLDINPQILDLHNLQEGLLNIGDNAGEVENLLVTMLLAALKDPGIPAGCQNTTLLGYDVMSVHITPDNVSEILRLYMSAHCEQTELAALTVSLKTKPFQAHSPSQKVSILTFLVNELCSSSIVISEIDRNMELIASLKKEKRILETKLRKQRCLLAEKTGNSNGITQGENRPNCAEPPVMKTCKRKERESEVEDDENCCSEDQ